MYIITKKVKNSTYVYLAESYRDENGQPKNRRHYIGRLDKDGTIITSKKKIPAQLVEIKTITKKFALKYPPKNRKDK